jgi:hypothetical protein
LGGAFFSSEIATSPNRMSAIMEPTTEMELQLPEALCKALSKAAVANERKMEEEIGT